MLEIRRELWKKVGYVYTARENGKLRSWARIKGNKNAKRQVASKGKEAERIKPEVTKGVNVSRIDYTVIKDPKDKRVEKPKRQPLPPSIKTKMFNVTVKADVFYKGRFIGTYDASSPRATYAQRKQAEEIATNNAIRRGILESGEVERYKNKIPDQEYTAKVIAVEYTLYVPNRQAQRYA